MKHFGTSRVAALLLALLLALSPALAAEPAPFSDVPAGSWYAQGVATCAADRILVGVGEGRFSPDTPLTQAECLTLALHLFHRQQMGGVSALLPAPEGWGRSTLTLDDGTELRLYGDQLYFRPNLLFQSRSHAGPEENPEGFYCVKLSTLSVDDAARLSDYHGGAAWAQGDQTSQLRASWLPLGSGEEEIAFVVTEGDAPHLSGVPGPDKWWRDTVYTAQVWVGEGELYPGFGSFLDNHSDWSQDAPATRLDLALLLSDVSGSLPASLAVEDIPDLEGELEALILPLYQGGILNGVDAYGSLSPDAPLTRAQAAVMAARLLDGSQRLTAPPLPLPTAG